MPVTVSQLAVAPVKGMRLHGTSEIRLGQHGVTGDREFLVIGEDGTLLLTSRTPALMQIEPAWDPVRDVLALRFPDGSVVQDTPEPGASAATRMYDGREIPGGGTPGPLSAALSGYLGREVRLFRREPEQLGHDDQPVTLMSEASLKALARGTRAQRGPPPVRPDDQDDGRYGRGGRRRGGQGGGLRRGGLRGSGSGPAVVRHYPEPGLRRH